MRSQSDPKVSYTVSWVEGKWTCECEDYAKRGKMCKHIYAVNFLLDLPRILLLNSDAFERRCIYCGSNRVRPKAIRYNKSGPVRVFRCKDCGRRFSDTITPEKGGAKAALAVIATDLYYKGISLRDLRSHLWQVYNVKVSASTLHRWIMKITVLLKKTFEAVKLEVGDKWLVDETIIKVEGEAKYLWNIMDYETRTYLASLLTDGREARNALAAIKEAIKNAKKAPVAIVTDGLKSYQKALEILGVPVTHIGNAGIAKEENNNRIERLHGIIKEWVNRRRGMKSHASELIEGYRNYYNLIRLADTSDQNLPEKMKWVSVATHAKQEKQRSEV
ncbi:MAG: IS6 family transposase [Thermoproteota archaeon]